MVINKWQHEAGVPKPIAGDENQQKIRPKWMQNRAQIDQKSTKIEKKSSPDVPQTPFERKMLVFVRNGPPNGVKMEPERSKNRRQVESENERISLIVVSLLRGGFSEVKVVENNGKSVSEGARERKRDFLENVGFTAVKP